MEFIILYAVASVVCFMLAGAAFMDNVPVAGVAITLIGGIVLVSCLGATGNNYEMLKTKTLDGRTYAVQAKVVDITGKKVYLLYDMQKKKNRAADLEIYPPDGYQEKTTTDGVILLTPTPGK